MATTKIQFGTSTAITVTLTSLASSATAGRESTAIDNTTNLFLDALLTVTVKLATGTPANDKKVYVYAYESEDGTTYNDVITGVDAAINLRVPSNLVVIGTIECPDAGALTYRKIFNVAPSFGGAMPRKWGIVIRNYTGVALDSSGNSATYTGLTSLTN